MTPEPLVSVIIPALNAASVIGETLTSCLKQTWTNLEIIVVDNGSSDGTLDVVHSLEAPSVRIYECARQGASAARNFGTSRSNGDYIQYLDADDVLSSSKIETQLMRLRNKDDRSLTSGPWVRFEKIISEKEIVPEAVWCDIDPQGFLIRSWTGGGMMPSFAWLTPRRIIEEAGPWDESLTLDDDGEFFTRVILKSSRILFCSGAIGYYRSTPLPSLSKAASRQALLSGFCSVDRSASHLLCVRDDAETRRACAYNYQRFAYAADPRYWDLVEKAERRVAELGGCDMAPSGGKLFQVLSAIVGWKKARRLHAALRS
jgi:glycosyltransferase involved in cell wall biosynthesis